MVLVETDPEGERPVAYPAMEFTMIAPRRINWFGCLLRRAGVLSITLALIWTGVARAEEDNPGAAAWRRGMALLGKGLPDAAIAQFKVLVEYDAKDPVSYCYRATAYARKADWQNVLVDAETAIRLDSKLAWAYVLRGQAHAGLKKNDAAMADFNQAIRLDPQFASAHIQRGYLHATLGQPENANADFRMANRLLVRQAGGEEPAEVK